MIKIDECNRNDFPRKNRTYDCSTSRNKKKTGRFCYEYEYDSEGDEEDYDLFTGRSATYNYKNNKQDIIEFLGDNPVIFENSGILNKTEKEGNEEFFEDVNKSSFIQIRKIEKPLKPILKKPTAYEIRFDFNKKDKDMTLRQAFKFHKQKLKEKIDEDNYIKKNKIIDIDRKFKNSSINEMRTRTKSGASLKENRRNLNMRRNFNKNLEQNYDISPDLAFRQFISKKKLESEKNFKSSDELLNFSESTFHNEEPSISKINERRKEIPQRITGKENRNKTISKTPRIVKEINRDRSLKKKIIKEYDQVILFSLILF